MKNTTTSQTAVRTPLRSVVWCNIWQRARSHDSDGYNSRIHLSASEGKQGETLCGNSYPAEKGHAQGWVYCKKCVRAAQKLGYSIEQVKALDEVPSADY